MPALVGAGFTQRVLRAVLIVVGVALALYLIVQLRRPLTWIFVAGFLATALSGPVGVLARHMKRGLAIALVYCLLVIAPFLLLGALVPPIVTQADQLIRKLPQYAADLNRFVSHNSTLRDLQKHYDFTGKLEEQVGKLPSKIGDAAGALSSIGLGIVNSVFALVTIVVLSIFLMNAGPRWLERWAARHPPERARWWRELFARIGGAVRNYVAGALVQATIAGVTSWVVLLILGVPYALPLAVVVFVLDLVPLVGATLGAIVVGIVTVFNDFPVDTIVWTVWSIAYQQIENNIIQPRIQGRAVQLEPLIVLISVLFGSTLFGILGALLAIPVAATLQIVIVEYDRLKALTLVTGTAPADVASPPEAPRA